MSDTNSEQEPPSESAPGWIIPGTITEVATADNVWLRGGKQPCHECKQPIREPVAFNVSFDPVVRMGYVGITYSTCSRTCAESLSQRTPNSTPHRICTEGRPSDPALRHEGWIYAYRTDGAYPDATERCGKWMVFIDVARIDAEWERVKAALHAGRLGSEAKVSTSPRRWRESTTHVLIIYTYDGDDTADVWRVRRELHALGYTWPIGWKADSDTLAGHYSGTGGRVSRHWG